MMALDAMNAIAVSRGDMARAWRGDDMIVDTALAAALDARVTALRAWSDASERAIRPSAVEAAALGTLMLTTDGIRFEPMAFDELVDFIDHLPW